jgi:3-deoxy-D-manno-octulosonate cytidylyltransferase
MKVVGIIPSRYGSVRLPAKPLALIAGKPLVQWVWERASQARLLDEVHVATDDERIAATVRSFGGSAILTPPECPSGTDRVAAALAGRGCDVDIAVNIQGDEPLMNPATIDACVSALRNDPEAAVSTPMVRLSNPSDYRASHVVKVVYDARGYALYFSRAPVPDDSRLADGGEAGGGLAMKHLGLYVYRWSALRAFVAMPPSRYEQAEKLEQLRFLEAGFRIRMVEVEHDSIGVDTADDLAAVEEILRRTGLA